MASDMQLTGWGRYPRLETRLYQPSSSQDATGLLAKLDGVAPRGAGRAYGDAAIGVGATLGLRALDRFKSFAPTSGLLSVEAGATLNTIIETFLPRGFFPPVVPGTKLATVGGAIAADVHGKNHHGVGSFGDHVESFELALPNGERRICSRTAHPELFDATIGGMGLTGAILSAAFRLVPVETDAILQQTIVAHDLEEAMAALTRHEDWPYSAAWIDCLARGGSLGRSLIYVGRHATQADLDALKAPPRPKPARKPLNVPFDLPRFTLNRGSVRLFNECYFRRGAAGAGAPFLSGIDPFFFPLDGVLNWNRIYGRRGFLQHQCVIDAECAPAALAEILDRFARRGDASFLAVLKKLGPCGRGPLSFPKPGFTLALDLAINRGVFEFLDEIDKIVIAAGGRIYLAKDARQSRASFEAAYPQLPSFRKLRWDIGAQGRIASGLSERLAI